jgi:ferredoxin
MEIRVDRVLCEANAVCCGLAPQVFELDDDENLVILVPNTADLAPEQLQRVEKAIERCPKNALSMVAVDA